MERIFIVKTNFLTTFSLFLLLVWGWSVCGNRAWALPVGDAIVQGKSLSEITELIKTNKSILDEKDGKGNAAIHWAIRKDRWDVVEALLDNGANINCPNSHENTPFLLALTLSKREIATKLLAKKDKGGKTLVDLSKTNEWNSNALLWTAKRGYDDLTDKILRDPKLRPEDINVKNKWNSTPLSWAARQGNTLQVANLVANGADLTVKHKEDNKTPLEFAQEAAKIQKDESAFFLLTEVEKALPLVCSDPTTKKPEPEVLSEIVQTIVDGLNQVKTQKKPHVSPPSSDTDLDLEFDPQDAQCLFAGWPGTFNKGDATCLLPNPSPFISKWQKEMCSAGEVLCNPALFGPKICLSPEEVSKGTDLNVLCLEKASKVDKHFDKISTFLQEKKARPFMDLFDPLYTKINELSVGAQGHFLFEDTDPLKEKKKEHLEAYIEDMDLLVGEVGKRLPPPEGNPVDTDPIGTLDELSQKLADIFQSKFGGAHKDPHGERDLDESDKRVNPSSRGSTKPPTSALKEGDLRAFIDSKKDPTIDDIEKLMGIFMQEGGIKDKSPLQKEVFTIIDSFIEENPIESLMKFDRIYEAYLRKTNALGLKPAPSHE